MADQATEIVVCDSCSTTHVGTLDPERSGWVRHQQRDTSFLMCPACEKWFTPIWDARTPRGPDGVKRPSPSPALNQLHLACHAKGLTIALTVGHPRRGNSPDVEGRDLGTLFVRKPDGSTVVAQNARYMGINRAAEIALSRLRLTVKGT